MGPGNPGPGGPPAGATGSGGDAGPVSEQGNKGADSSLETGNPGPGGPPGGATGSGGDAGLGGAVYSSLVKGQGLSGAVYSSLVKGKTESVVKVKGTDPNSQLTRGRGRRSALSKDGKKEISLPFRDVPVKPSKEKPGKGKPAADSKGKPVFVSGVKPAEHKADSNDNEVEDEVAKAFLSEEKK